MSALAVAVNTLARSQDRVTSLLTILAIALPHAVLLAVIGGVLMFHTRAATPVNEIMADGPHLVFAYFAATMVVVPALSMGAAAARLGLVRKARTLATLRLIGITPTAARGAALIDTLVHACIGVIVGSLIYGITLPVWSLLSFQDVRIGARELWVGTLPLLVAALVMIGLTTLSSVVSMQKVAITPLGVVRNNERVKVNIIALIGVGTVMLVWLVVSPLIGGFGHAVAMSMLLGFMATMIGLMNVVGVASVTILGRVIARLSRSAAGTLAGRRLAADPKAVWRSFGGLGLVAFLVGLTMPIIHLILTVSTDQSMDKSGRIILTDINTGLLLTLGISAVLAAISTAIQQAIRAIDSAPQRLALADMGAPQSYWVKARRSEVAYPAVATIGGSVLVGMLFISPIAVSGSSLLPFMGVALSMLLALVLVLAAAESARLLER